MIQSSYSRLDRFLHRFAFDSIFLQEFLEDLEKKLFGKNWQNIPVFKPIFITSLPRAGTTILLESLSRLPHTISHTYRDMPFVLSPVIWDKFSKNLRKKSIKRERAHGDGLYINEDSPEAFEEIIWRKFFPSFYRGQSLELWHLPIDKAFGDYFKEHIRKLILTRQNVPPCTARYISKNNGNIARLDALRYLFPDAKILVPVRHPVEHSISLWRQHKNFKKKHKKDQFSIRYMRDVGHYEFGVLHKPINFPKLSKLVGPLQPDSIDYWLAYWIAAFDYIQTKSFIQFIHYESFCQNSQSIFFKLADFLELDTSRDELYRAAEVIDAPPVQRNKDHHVDQELYSIADALFYDIKKRCL